MSPRVVLAVSAVVCAVVGAVFVLSPQGLAKLERLEQEETALSAEVARKTKENERLARQIEALRGDSEASKNALEKRAREELGFVGKGEVAVTLDDAAHADGGTP